MQIYGIKMEGVPKKKSKRKNDFS